MPTMTRKRFFGKGPLLRAIDRLSESLDFAAQQEILLILQGPPGEEGLAQLAGSLGLASPQTVRHLEEDWFGSWWPECQPIEPILRAGIAQALHLALADPEAHQPREQPLAIHALWLSGVDRVEVGISLSAGQVTLLLLTPPVPDADEGRPDALDPVWMVHRGAPRSDEQVVASQGDLVTTQIRTRLEPPEEVCA